MKKKTCKHSTKLSSEDMRAEEKMNDESNQSVKLSAKNQAAIELLRSWREDDEYDEEEQKATWEFLKQALDEDRLSDRKLFPEA